MSKLTPFAADEHYYSDLLVSMWCCTSLHLMIKSKIGHGLLRYCSSLEGSEDGYSGAVIASIGIIGLRIWPNFSFVEVTPTWLSLAYRFGAAFVFYH